ncbi:MFS transporter [Cytophagaceae bacterium DM2B3-1]|uniref:MFS transporter n=1 Tax=Xanthocytophaga flava TaxID=3048013 RepID=A0ABT7CL12_9BACT|nr:MFS transporter [Xanthocytophaga flavus]MDJ1469871.1 MFS transporter [Xanthocytophaga flavus]MDJ1494383.1 MFS transporter [Xanthocytophaga flavus]
MKTIQLPEKNNPKVLNAWCSYDWANSVYNLTITSAIFPIYYNDVTSKAPPEGFGKNANGETMIDFLGLTFDSQVLYSYAISASFLVIVFLAPILSGIADYSGKKKRFMQFFTYLGSTACLGLFFFKGLNIEYGILCAFLASIGYAGSLVFYNGFLPQIATPDRMDKVSARGYSMGYIGSVILLVLNLVMIFFNDVFGLETRLIATRVSFLTVGIWWIGFSQIAFYYLKDIPTNHSISTGLLTKGFDELKKVFAKVRASQHTFRYLLGFFFWSMGVQSIMLMAPFFGERTIGMEGTEMIAIVLILQLVAIPGAIAFSRIAMKVSNTTAILIAIILWIGICVAAYFITTKTEFYILAGFVGIVMGAIQSVSRSTYAQLIPQTTTDTASYFSLYDVTEKLAIVIGTFTYGRVLEISHNVRLSALSMGIFFIAGGIFLVFARLPRRVSDAVASN